MSAVAVVVAAQVAGIAAEVAAAVLALESGLAEEVGLVPVSGLGLESAEEPELVQGLVLA